MEEDKEFIQAKDYAYKLLSYRQRSIQELGERLKKKGFSERAISKSIEYLRELGYLNDENFARFWIQAKVSRAPLGWLLLRYQLQQKGISPEILVRLSAEFAQQYNEAEAAKSLAQARRRQYRDLKPLKLKRRLYSYLHRRGFSQEAISQAIRNTD